MVLASIFCSASPTQAEGAGSEDKFKSITGISREESKSCQKESDCVLISGFSDCCKQESINKKHRDVIERNRNALWDALTSPDMKHNCSLMECMPPREQAVCRKNQCSTAPLYFPAQLMEKQVHKIADDFMVKSGLDIHDFDVPTIGYGTSTRMWGVHYGTKRSTHEKNMRTTGQDKIYDVVVSDLTKEATLQTTVMMDPKWSDPNCLIQLFCN